MHPRSHFGVDLGGTKTELIVINETGDVLFRERVPTPSHDYESIIMSVNALVTSAEDKLGVRAERVGIGVPGAISPATGLMKNANTTCLIGRRFKEDLQLALGRDVTIANDANCFALSEAVDGAGEGAPIVFGVILGTGVGGGIVINGRVLTGENAICGEWGHNPLPWPTGCENPGPACYCGRSGCIETFLSGPALKRDHERMTGKSLDTKAIVTRALDGDGKCEATLQRYENRLARALAGVVNILDPNVIVLGGGLSEIERLYKNVPRIWREFVFSDDVTTRLRPAQYGSSSGVRGAAWL